jgi:hypothetical protein
MRPSPAIGYREQSFLWRRRPAGGFSFLRTSQKRRRDAGATAPLVSSNIMYPTSSPTNSIGAFQMRGTSGTPRHTNRSRYRCSLPGLAGFAGLRRTEPEVPRIGSRSTRKRLPRQSSTATRAKKENHFGFEYDYLCGMWPAGRSSSRAGFRACVPTKNTLWVTASQLAENVDSESSL